MLFSVVPRTPLIGEGVLPLCMGCSPAEKAIF